MLAPPSARRGGAVASRGALSFAAAVRSDRCRRPGDAKATIDLPTQPEAVCAYAGREVVAGLRAEAIADGTEARNGGRRVRARVEITEPTGADTLAVLNVAGQEFTARLAPEFPVRPGEEADFTFDASKFVFFDKDSGQRIRQD